MKRGKTEWLAAALVVLVMGVVLILVLLSTINPHSHDAQIELPDDAVFDSVADAQIRPQSPGDQASLVEITVQNVQNVIRTLDRPSAYYMKAESILSYGDESRVTVAEQWLSTGRCVVRTEDSLTDRVLCSITDREGVAIWYEGEDEVLTGGAAAFLQQDMLAGIPTYEDVLSLTHGSIIAASYVPWNEELCILVEVYDPALEYTLRYYISVESGMLVHAETYTGGALVYSMNLLELSDDLSVGDAMTPPA